MCVNKGTLIIINEVHVLLRVFQHECNKHHIYNRPQCSGTTDLRQKAKPKLRSSFTSAGVHRA